MKLGYLYIKGLVFLFTSLSILSIIGILTFGYIPFGIILTTSMLPHMPPGTVVFAIPVFNVTEQIQIGDVVIYCYKAYIPGTEIPVCKPIVHRVIGFRTDGKLLIKGDANNVIEIVDPSQVKSKVIFYIPSFYYIEIDRERGIGFWIPCGILLFVLLLALPKYYEVTIRRI